ncbi:hypothetical protein Tco_0082779, partial [Tanacetum coccineum]
FDVTISLSELQMMLSVADLSGVSSKETIIGLQERKLQTNNESLRKSKEMVSDEGAERNYHLAGTMHYSLARETALFRVCNLYSHCNSCMKFANSYSTIISQLKLTVLTKSGMN